MKSKPLITPEKQPSVYSYVLAKRMVFSLGIYFLFQLMIPFRHWLYLDHVNWT